MANINMAKRSTRSFDGEYSVVITQSGRLAISWIMHTVSYDRCQSPHGMLVRAEQA